MTDVSEATVTLLADAIGSISSNPHDDLGRAASSLRELRRQLTLAQSAQRERELALIRFMYPKVPEPTWTEQDYLTAFNASSAQKGVGV